MIIVDLNLRKADADTVCYCITQIIGKPDLLPSGIFNGVNNRIASGIE